MSQPPPPPGNPPPPGTPDGAVPPPQAQGGGYGYPAQAAGPPPADNPYAQPVPPAQNPYAQAPTQPAFPQAQPGFPQGQFPQGAPPPPPPYPGQQGPQQPGAGQPYGQQPPYGQQMPPQPGPYGYQNPQPGAPYGMQPPYPGQQSGPGGGRNNKLIAIVAAVVAAVLVITGGVYLATRSGSGHDPAPKPLASSGGPTSAAPTGQPTHRSTLSFQWDKPADTVAEKDNLKYVLGIWFTDKYVVKNQIGKVVAYDLATGTQAWTIAAPSSGQCTAARDTFNNMAAIQFGAKCDQIMVIDLVGGKTLWTAKLPGGTAGGLDFDYTEMAISGDTLGVDWLSGSIGYRLSTQKVLWQGGAGDCEDDGYAGGKQFVSVVNCNYDTYKVDLIDPEHNGRAKWEWTAPTGTKVNAIVSTDPVVVLLGTEDKRFTDAATIVDGRLQSRVSLGTDKYRISDDGSEKQSVHNVLVSNDTLYLSLDSKSDSNGKVLSGIVAFNLSDGKQRWLAKPDDKHAISGLDFVDGKLLAYEAADYDVAGKLVTLDPATGAAAPYATFDSAASDHLDVSSSEGYLVWHRNRFYVVAKTIYEGNENQAYLESFG